MQKKTQGRGRLAATLLGCASATAMAAGLIAVAPAHALVTPETRPANDPSQLNTGAAARNYWVGLGIRNVAGTGGSTCTGLLINPRTVLFAAHCVDDTAMNQYNAAGSRASVAYTTDPTFGIGNLRQWLFGNQANGQPQAGSDGRTMTAESVNVFFHPQALNNSSNGGSDLSFLSADIAMAAFGTAFDLGRNNADTIGLLFSPVDRKVPVVMGGFGQSGNGLTGTRQSDFRRRLGNNILGFLGSERDITVGVYGSGPNGSLIADFLDPPGRYQDLYWVDFDDPLRGTRNPAYPFDFDIFPDDAVPGVNGEAITASGDSGSPLVTNAYGKDVSLGVLSQGSRYFFGQDAAPYFTTPAFSNYGTTAGYNPLFLFWDFIVANNPYKYASVASTAATVEWSDASIWRQDMDPNYFVLQNGQLVNGLPTTGALGVSDATTNVGSVKANPNPLPACAITNGCPNGRNTPPDGPVDSAALPDTLEAGGSATASQATRGTVGGLSANTTMGDPLQGVDSDTTMAGSVQGTPGTEAQNVQGAWPTRPGSDPTSGPGSTNFRPNNQNGASGVFNSARFFEVTLNRAGQTVNLSANGVFTNNTVTIDRLNLSGATTTLNIASGARLNTELRSYVDAGTLNVNGTLSTAGLSIFGGALNVGAGGVASSAGRTELSAGVLDIAQGSSATTGRFTTAGLAIAGGRLQGSGTVVATGTGVDNAGGTITAGGVGSVGTLTVTGNLTNRLSGVIGIDLGSATSADRINVSGVLTLGGTAAINAIGSYVPTFNTSWVVATGGTATGSFTTLASNLPGVLVPVFTTANNQVTLRIDARPFAQAVAPTTAAQVAFANALDSSRNAEYLPLKALYDALDPLSAPAARAALERLNPDDAYLARQNGRTQVNFLNDALATRMSKARAGGQGVTMAGLAPSLFAGSTPDQLMAMNPVESQLAQDTAEAASKLKAGYGLFLDVRRLDGDTASPTGLAGDVKNTLVTVGVDRVIADSYLVGVAASYAKGDSDTAGNIAQSDSKTMAGSLYASYFTDNFFVDAYVTAGDVDSDTTRRVLGFTLEGETDGDLLGAGLGAGYDVKLGSFGFVPEVRYDFAQIKYGAYEESGGAAALRIGSEKVTSNQFRFGTTLYGEFKVGEQGAIIPKITLFRVHEGNTANDAVIGSRFFAAPNVAVVGAPEVKRDKGWNEFGGGLTFRVNASAELSFNYEASSKRRDLDTQTYVGTFRYRF